MTDLSPAARELIRRACEFDGPHAQSKSKVQRKLTASLAGGGAMTGALRAASGAKATAMGWSAAMAGGAKIALVTAAVLSAGGILGLSVYDSAEPTAHHRNVSPPTMPLTASGTPMVGAPLPFKPLSETPAASDAPALPGIRSADVESDARGTGVGPLQNSVATRSTASLPQPEFRLRTSNQDVKPSVTNAVASSGTESTSSVQESLIIELGRLKAANQALDSGSPDEALSLVEVASQTLQPEFLAIRVLALCQKGDRAAGSHWREIFLSHYGSSALAARVRGACVGRDQ